ncbi:MAG TPA: phage tail protein [Caproiciproducens sp.]|nr:phage tail protein [Caproiciproducens sp.]
MADTYKMIITQAGHDKIMSALSNSSKVNITQVAVGDGAGAAYTPTNDMTALKGEKWRGNVNKIVRNPDDANIIIVTGIIPVSQGGFFVREIGIFDDSGTMIAVGNYPECYKPTPDSGCSKDMTIEVWLIVSDASAINLTANLSVVQATLGDMNELDAKYTPEVGTVTLNNTKVYPFSDSDTTINLITARNNLDYTVETEVVSSTGSVERVEVYGKQLNGFKIRFLGSGTAATIKYYVRGGLVR